jgi:ribosomal protein S12 methylthiotransferase accessory factor
MICKEEKRRSLPEFSLHDLSGPMYGLFGAELSLRSRSDEPKAITHITNLGDLGQVWPHIPKLENGQHQRSPIAGTGVGLDEQASILPSRAEALERYCSSVYQKEQFVTASADELGREAIDLEAIPRCSEAELSHPRCPLVAPNKKAKYRWIRGLSLLTGQIVYIPAVMVYLYTGFLSRDERICVQISTGCAAHSSLERALISAILEVVERDAIAITWLQKLSLPRIEFDQIPSGLVPHWEAYQRSSKELEYLFFDATTDIGISTVYGLQVSRANDRFRTLVSCSANLDPVVAIAKVMNDMAASREAFRVPRHIPDRPEDCDQLFDGASYMAQTDQARAFEFLLRSLEKKRLSEMASFGIEREREALRVVLAQVQSKGLAVYAIEISTDEALRAGMRVVRVIIPGLQPFSFHYRAQYLGHPRLYQAPKSMGYRALQEEQLNRWPQPFA